jgi:putative CocE/NonD family hydrolase
VRYAVDPGSSTGPTNRWLAGEIGRGAAYPDRRGADETLLTFTSAPLSADLHVLGFPVMTLRLATNGTDGVVYVYLEDVGPDGSVTYLTEGCLRFLQRATAGPAEPTGLGVPRSFARADRLPVEPGEDLDLVVELLPVSALLRSGHGLRIAIAGNDASCFSYYGSPGETFTVTLGGSTHLDLPVLRTG